MRSRLLVILLTVLVAPISSAAASTALFSLSIGYNGVSPEAREAGAEELSFADDDALAVHELALTVARRSVVLAIPDRSTQAHYRSAREARAPSLAELRRVLAELKADIEEAGRSGDDTAIWFFYSGHGWLDPEGRASLTLADAPLTQRVLYEEVLPALSGHTVHLMIDACHAEALIRSRDITAETVELSATEIATTSLRQRLQSLPHVGLMMASASNGQAHEWDDFQTGVFTHELLSGLRGGADVNGDGRIEYSEMAAFLAAANRSVTDPRARLTTIVVPPQISPRVAIVDLRDARGVAPVKGPAHHLGHFAVDDESGNRLLDLRAEPGFAVSLWLPAQERVLLGNGQAEVAFQPRSDRVTRLDELTLDKKNARTRGAVAQSMRRGLFATAFGPSYYRGFVDSSDQHFVPVEIEQSNLTAFGALPAPVTQSRSPWPFVLGAVPCVASGVLAVLAARAYHDSQSAEFERPSVDARDRYVRYGIASISSGIVGAIVLGGYWLWTRNSPVHAAR